MDIFFAVRLYDVRLDPVRAQHVDAPGRAGSQDDSRILQIHKTPHPGIISDGGLSVKTGVCYNKKDTGGTP